VHVCLCRKESRLITKASMIRSLNQGLFYSLVSLSSFATFSTYAGLGNVVTPRKVFTVITIFSVTRIFYFYTVVNCLLGLSDMLVALKRIQVTKNLLCMHVMFHLLLTEIVATTRT